MQTSRFQLGLIATLAVGLGFSLSSSEAVGYPAGAAVSLGTNPVASWGGQVESSGTTIFSAEADGPFLITDVVLTVKPCGGGSTTSTVIVIEDAATAEVFAMYSLSSDTDNDGGSDDAGSSSPMVRHAYSTGVVVPAGRSAVIRSVESICSAYYSLAGYQSQG